MSTWEFQMMAGIFGLVGGILFANEGGRSSRFDLVVYGIIVLIAGIVALISGLHSLLKLCGLPV